MSCSDEFEIGYCLKANFPPCGQKTEVDIEKHLALLKQLAVNIQMGRSTES